MCGYPEIPGVSRSVQMCLEVSGCSDIPGVSTYRSVQRCLEVCRCSVIPVVSRSVQRCLEVSKVFRHSWGV